jgi:hypothetical protein
VTPLQKEDFDREIHYLYTPPEKWEALNKMTPDARFQRFVDKVLPWVCAAIAVPIVIIIGCEIIFHAWAFIKG